MTLKQKTLLAILALAIVSLPACTQKPAPPGPAPNVAPGPGQGVGQQDKRVFYISLYTDPAHPDQCYADWPQATLWKDHHQTVQWISDDRKDYIVDFSLSKDGSPFADPSPTFKVPANGVKDSGDLSPNSQKGTYYAYGIRAGTNANGPICKPASDPGLYVK
jgi:hypothetical protein